MVFDAGHEEVNVPLYICVECLHKLKELRPGCHIDVTVHLQVQGFRALEGMVFVSYGPALAESTGALFSGSLGVSSQFDVESVVGASEL